MVARDDRQCGARSRMRKLRAFAADRARKFQQDDNCDRDNDERKENANDRDDRSDRAKFKCLGCGCFGFFCKKSVHAATRDKRHEQQESGPTPLNHEREIAERAKKISESERAATSRFHRGMIANWLW